MRYMMLVKGDKNYEAGVPPTPELMAAIGGLAEEMFRSGKLLDMGGLAPSSKGALLELNGGTVRVTDGPFAESKEVVGGYAIMEAGSKAEAIELGKRFLQVHADVLGNSHEAQLEIRLLSDPPQQS